MNNPIDKLQMLKDSQKCLTFGLMSLLSLVGVPFVMMAMASRNGGSNGFFWFCFLIAVLSAGGFPFAVMTMVISVETRESEKEFWNAARPYRIIGTICAMITVVSSFIVFALVAFLVRTSSQFGN